MEPAAIMGTECAVSTDLILSEGTGIESKVNDLQGGQG